MARRITFKPSASKDFESLPRHIQRRFAERFPLLEVDPFTPRSGLDIQPMQGTNTWRLHIGHYRGLYEVDEDNVRFMKFGHRSTVYR